MKNDSRGHVFTLGCAGPPYRLAPLLRAAGLPECIGGAGRILIKPNLVEALPPPITTPVALIAALIDFLRTVSDAELIVGEGTGASSYDTRHCFDTLGYTRMAAAKGVKLVDLNQEPVRRLSRPELSRWPQMHIPDLAMDSFLLSVPVLKAHSLAGVTLTLKNMMGLPPPEHYQEGRSWKKSSFHLGMQDAVRDLNRYRTPDFTLMDATVGMAQAHLWGPTCEPPVGLLVAGRDPVAMDAHCCTLLGRDWRRIGHIAELHGVLGQGEPLHLHPVETSMAQ